MGQSSAHFVARLRTGGISYLDSISDKAKMIKVRTEPVN